MSKKFVYGFYINQSFGFEHGLNLKEGAVLDYISRAFQWADTKKIEGNNYCKLHSQKIIDDMPQLEIKTKNGIRKIISSLVQKGVVVRLIVNKTEPYFRVIEGYNFWKGEGATIGDPINIINNNIIGLKDLLKEKDYILEVKNLKKAINDLSSILDGLKEKTDLGGISVIELIDMWNGQDVKLWKRINVSNPNSKMIQGIKEKWGIIQRNYTKEEFLKGLENYIIDINNRDDKNSYSEHRFTLAQFISQSNGLEKFMQYG